jgi:UDP:flavonoid glycosyltransferase YjiC (YdhE family)
MTQVLFLSDPSQADVRPILGLANELITKGEKVTFFSSDEFKQPIVEIGADFKAYTQDLNIFGDKEIAVEGEKPQIGIDQCITRAYEIYR